MLSAAKVATFKKQSVKIAIAILRAAFFILLAFVVLYPLFTQITAMFMTPEDIHDLSVRYIPKHPTIKHLINAWGQLKISTSFPYTVIFTTVIGLLQTLSCTLGGYGLAKFKFKLNTPLTIIIIIGLLLPPDLLQIPLYTFFRNFRLFGIIPALNDGVGISFINTPIPSLVLALTGSGFRCGLYVLIMRQFFRGVPRELEDAAAIDGAGHLGCFVKIMIPSAVTMMVTVFLFSFVWTWLDTDFLPIFMGENNLLIVLAQTLNDLHLGGATDEISRNLTAYSGILFLTVPLLILYLFTQRFFVESVERSGLVG